MRRTVLLLSAALLAGCGAAATEPLVTREAAAPQTVELGWRELYPASSKRLVFLVERLEVGERGWSVEIGVRNETDIAFDVDRRPGQPGFGVMLFATPDLAELEEAGRNGSLPAVREAAELSVPPPARLRPGASWSTRLSAPGPLPAGAHLRVAFGPFRAVGEPPEGMEPVVFWITDRSRRL